ncbi:15075_t:CDS:2, partial [Racocetra fulgida]
KNEKMHKINDESEYLSELNDKEIQKMKAVSEHNDKAGRNRTKVSDYNSSGLPTVVTTLVV